MNIGRTRRVSFVIKRDIRSVVDFDDGLSVAVYVCQAVCGGDGLVHPSRVTLRPG